MTHPPAHLPSLRWRGWLAKAGWVGWVKPANSASEFHFFRYCFIYSLVWKLFSGHQNEKLRIFKPTVSATSGEPPPLPPCLLFAALQGSSTCASLVGAGYRKARA